MLAGILLRRLNGGFDPLREHHRKAATRALNRLPALRILRLLAHGFCRRLAASRGAAGRHWHGIHIFEELTGLIPSRRRWGVLFAVLGERRTRRTEGRCADHPALKGAGAQVLRKNKVVQYLA